MGLTREAKALYAPTRRERVIQLLKLPITVEQWRRPNGPECELMMILARQFRPVEKPALRVDRIEINLTLNAEGQPVHREMVCTVAALEDPDLPAQLQATLDNLPKVSAVVDREKLRQSVNASIQERTPGLRVEATFGCSARRTDRPSHLQTKSRAAPLLVSRHFRRGSRAASHMSPSGRTSRYTSILPANAAFGLHLLDKHRERLPKRRSRASQ